MKTYNLMLVSFDGAKVIERVSGTIDECWDHCNDLGSKWYFYPFSFVVSEKTIIDTCENLEHFKGLRIKTVLKRFATVFESTKDLELDAEQYLFEL